MSALSVGRVMSLVMIILNSSGMVFLPDLVLDGS